LRAECYDQRHLVANQFSQPPQELAIRVGICFAYCRSMQSHEQAIKRQCGADGIEQLASEAFICIRFDRAAGHGEGRHAGRCG